MCQNNSHNKDILNKLDVLKSDDNLERSQKKSLDKFIMEHEKDPKSDRQKFDKAIESISRQNPKSTQETSDSDSFDD